jgi:hypothetical protein
MAVVQSDGFGVDGRPAMGDGRAGTGGGVGLMTTKVTIGIVAAMLLGVAGAAHAQMPEFDRIFQSLKPQPQQQPQQKQKAAPKQQVYVQKRAPARITVRPILRERLDSTEFPRSDYLGYPGPNAVRQCVSWLQPEYRQSGTVVTPQTRCWWQRG